MSGDPFTWCVRRFALLSAVVVYAIGWYVLASGGRLRLVALLDVYALGLWLLALEPRCWPLTTDEEDR